MRQKDKKPAKDKKPVKTNTPAKENETAVAAAGAFGEVEALDRAKPSERINYHVAQARHHGRLSLAHLLAAGWELARQKQSIGYGGWVAWCDKNLEISQQTADRYIEFYSATIGARRAEAQVPIETRPTEEELAAATMGMEGKSATRAMADLGIINRASWGGPRAGAGRKAASSPEGVDAALDEAANREGLLWACARGSVDALVSLQADKDYLSRLTDEHLADISRALAALSDAAAKAFAKRMEGRLPARIGSPENYVPELGKVVF